ncbi:MAG: DUF349 domain-containing protein [Bacteroidetes bacterium]|nr:MAG: DUF349 domain-containing protein [Bacteroidota bacterium]
METTEIQHTAEEILIETHHEETDFSTFSKADFEELVAKSSKSNFSEQYSVYKKIKNYIDDLFEAEKHAALDKFLADGGETDDFEYHGGAFYEKFDKLFVAAKKNATQEFKDSQLKKESNYKSKLAILQQIKDLIENASIGKNGYEKFKKLQDEWKNAGAVPQERAQELWSNYHAVVNRFYDQRSIAFEILDLDRKRNLQAKLYLCDKAEKLTNEPIIKKALRELEELHDEFKHIGPVPKENQEEIWTRFKNASDKIHENKTNFYESEKLKQAQNLLVKQQLLIKLQELSQFSGEKTSEWQEASKKIEEFQLEWKKAGLIELDKLKEINRQYWDGLKNFFNNKRTFFNALDAEKKENLKLKNALSEKAEALLAEENTEESTKIIVQLQNEWKTIGHVPLKVKDKVYERFKKACDAVFDKKRGVYRANQEQAKLLLKEKSDFLANVEKSSYSTAEEIQNCISGWNQIAESSGPEYQKLYNQFAEAIRVKLKPITAISENEKDIIVIKLQIEATKLGADSAKDFGGWERKMRKDLRDIEDEIAQMKNNMAFFARAKNADAINKDFNAKIAVEEKKMSSLKTKLNLLVNR